ncbi:MAG TPA: glycosyltransferase family 4 protein [Stellaceae bacterium]|nr:glycosyltransferase family 4 protein [Stellaceae bacterium]
MTPRRVAFVLKGYPRLSETFIAQEILALEQRGLDILIVSLRRPSEPVRHPVHRAIGACLLYLPEYLYREPRRVWRGWRAARRRPGYARAWRAFVADLRRDPTPNRIRRFGQALVLARELPAGIGHLHAHFLHTPASVARYAALLLGLDWTVSAHAKDIWTIPSWEKRRKLADAAWAVTCTAIGHRHLAALAPHPARVALCYHGLDLARFPPPPPRPIGGDGGDPRRPVVLLSVGRAVAKKGYDDLLAALALLPRGLAWRFVHIGAGGERRRLMRRALRLGLADRIEWRGALPQPEVLAAYRAADLFVLAAKIAKDGDRDGLPNVLVEAQSQGLPCVATTVSGIPELIRHGREGLLAPPGDPAALAALLENLIRDPARRARLGASGQKRVHGAFDMRAGIAALATRFGLPAAVMDEAAAPPPGRTAAPCVWRFAGTVPSLDSPGASPLPARGERKRPALKAREGEGLPLPARPIPTPISAPAGGGG